ncbi:MAG: CsiV family protein [Gammaproteobacteria bacterium]
MKLLLTVLLIAMASAAQARWYQVDVVVFRHSSGMTTAGEQWPELENLPDFRRSVRLDEDGQRSGEAPQGGPTAFQRLARGERRLDGAAGRVSGGDYELLLADAWRQPSFGVAGAKRVYLSDLSDGSDPATLVVGPGGVVAAIEPRIEGTVAIKVARLLHIEVDVLYRHEDVVVRLSETRRAKLRETHYFDHPLFGVLVQVSPFVVPEVAATDGLDAAYASVDEATPSVGGAATPAELP